MTLHVGTTNLYKKLTAIVLSLLLCQPAFSQSIENQQMVFEGHLTDTSGNSVNLSGEQLIFYVSANGCYLYGESSTVSGDNQGNVLHRFGNGSVVAGSPNTFSQNLFFGTVTGTTTFAGNDCTVNASHTRVAQLYSPNLNISATIKLGTVPYAQNATRLNGKTDSDFVAASADTYTIFSSGTSGQYLTKGVSGLTWTNLALTAAQISTALGYTPASSTAGWITSLNGLTNSSQTFAIGSTGNSLTITSSGSVHTFNIPLAGASSSAGLLSSSDYASFSNKLGQSNNLSDIASASAARSNLGLGSLATKSSVNLATDVFGILPIANGGTQWSDHANGLYTVSNTTIGSSTVFANTRLYVEASSTAQTARFTNTSTSGYGLRIDVAGSSAAQYALNVNTGLGSAFMVENDGRVGVGTMSPVTRLDVSGAVRIGFENVTCSSTQAGTIRYFSGVLEYCDGSSYKAISAVSDGLNVLNGLSNPSQNFAIQSSSTETALSISSSGSTHTFTLPMANTSGVTAGLLNNTDYSFFANKLNANSSAIATVLGYTPANSATVLLKANNLSDVPDKSAARANLQLGTFATASTIDLGSASATGILASARLPAMSGDISSTAGSANMTLVALRGTSLSSTAPASGQVLKYNGSQWAPSAELWNMNGTSINYTNGNVGIGTTSPNALLTVNGSIKMAGDGSDNNVSCTASEEGKQRYNSTHKTMEYCDGSYWQGVAGPSHCAGSSSMFTLVGKAGTGSAFCMSKNTEGFTNYTSAVAGCIGKTTGRGSKPMLCTEVQYDLACKEYNTLGETGLPGFKTVDYWMPMSFSSNGSYYFTIQFITGAAGTCVSGDQSISTYGVTSTTPTYRCCYQ